MSDTNDLREQVTRALFEHDMSHEGYTPGEPGDPWPTVRESYGETADVALSVAAPIIRAQVIEGLIAEAQSLRDAADRRHEDRSEWMWRGVADWLRAQGLAGPDDSSPTASDEPDS